MNKQSEIEIKQNDPAMLDCQYTARMLFNSAEKLSYHALICGIGSAFCIFLTGDATSLLVPIILDILILVFAFYTKTAQSKAAMVRKYFDATVLEIRDADFPETDLRTIYDIVDSWVKKKPQEYKLQVKNTGRDIPPGVKNWYEFSKDYPENEAVFECQRQNCWWNKKQFMQRCLVTIIVSVLFAVSYGGAVVLLHVSVVQNIVCLLGLLIALIDQIYENYRYWSLSKTMEDYIKLPGLSQNNEQIEYLQSLIDERRSLLVLEMNWIHKKNSKSWSEKYEQISKH